ncbi:MAG TPA: hypothetical protein VJR27_02605 [Candidatus Saccharimonadales bacterium]|nr:hypothetical protein [Candidatus Saccharimonadales bacterium]
MELGKFVPQDTLETAYARGQLRFDLQNNPAEMRPRDAIGYDECVQVYEEAQNEHATTSQQFIGALADAQVVTGNTPGKGTTSCYTSWHYGEHAIDDDALLPVAYKIEAVVANGRLIQTGYNAPITVSTYPLHKPTHANFDSTTVTFLTGRKSDLCFSESDKLTSTMQESEVQQRSFEEVVRDAYQKVREAALDTALQDWADQLVEQPGVELAKVHAQGQPAYKIKEWRAIFDALNVERGETVFGLESHEKLASFMLKKMNDQAEALDSLKHALSSVGLQGLGRLLRQQPKDLKKDLARANWLPERYNWTMTNMLTIRKDATMAIGNALHAHFRDTFMAELAVETTKTHELRTLAASITKDTVPINDCAPKKS